MRVTILGLIGVMAIGAGLLRSASQDASSASPSLAPQRAILDQYCVTCHNEKLKTAGLMLDKMNLGEVSENAAVWEKVVRKVRTGQMPPAGMPRPDKAAYDSLAAYLEAELDRAAAAHPNPGRPVLRRLNRAEYANAIRDLVALEIDSTSLLPTDESAHGFDNIGDALSVSPLLLERYLSAARKISRLAIGDSTIRPVFETYDVPRYLMQEDRTSEDLPFGSRGGVAIRHYFPLDGEYTIKIGLQRNARDYIRGLGEPHQLDVRLDGARIKLFTVGGDNRGRSSGIFSSASQGDPEQERYERNTAEAALEFRLPVKAGARVLGITFLKKAPLPEGPLQPRLTQIEFSPFKGGIPAIGSVTIAGPYNATGTEDTPSRRKIFVCHPANANDNDEVSCARKILSTLARRAYRRPVTDADIQTLLSFYEDGRSERGFEAGIGMALERMLISPAFLFRIERDPQGVAANTAYPVSGLELASRLSFFLWSSLPDEELLGLAEDGKLKDPAVLEQQVRRMMADSRAKTLVSNFAGLWLQVRNLRSVSPDPEAFPYFDEELREAFQQETELFFESMLREDRSALELLNADYTFLNERLARHYQIPNVYGSHFRRVTLAGENENRRGLLGQGSILTVTSYANRTSLVLRGKWVMNNILGTPPPPPPANVPSLKEQSKDGKVLSLRERMEQHRANPACASCHKVMDPLGFALENFDGIGHWRTRDGDSPIDSSGVLPDGSRFEGPLGLRKVLRDKKEQFVHTVTEKLLTYALGRGLEYYDAPVVRQILREAAPDNYRWSSLVLGIARSTAFQMRRSQSQ
ncbi:MAG: DUF1592 domain-containing protein [Acidobacteria bacterium]|nr:DUF1592 domain-containing protein [Acidobacteriota bacterium]